MKYLAILVTLLVAVEANWQLTFQDEFNTNQSLDASKWTFGYLYTPTVINGELQYYTPDSFLTTGYSLKIIGRQRQYNSVIAGRMNYSSGAMITAHKFYQSYGYFEMRAKLPVTKGSWPAFWMMPEFGGGPKEIDIVETVNNPSTVYNTFHCNYSTGGSSGGSKGGFNNSNFHTYAVQWIPGSLIWYVDGVQTYALNSSCVPDAPSYMMLNLAIGGGWPGAPDSTTKFPIVYEIDYVRAYKYIASGGGTIPGAVGAGIPFTPRSYNQPAVKWGGVTINPLTAAPGSTVTFTVKYTPVTAALDRANFQLRFSNDTNSDFANIMFVGGSAPVGVEATATGTWTVPAGYATGYIRVGLGAWTSSWSSLYYQTCDGYIGVNRIVGGYY